MLPRVGKTMDGLPFIVTEYVTRGSVEAVLRDDTISLPFTMRLSFMIDAAKGMAFLHSLNPPLIHRDLVSRIRAGWRFFF